MVCRSAGLRARRGLPRGHHLRHPHRRGARLALDANRPEFDASGPPRFFLWTDDIAATVAHLEGLGVTITSDVEDIGSVFFVRFEDPDGNALMVCQRA